ncbi:MAG: hypothetical protein JST00_14955 [Deltaproteobacteria bacterium]|nr:hypothetical protein [Deltaproteobacteria bacterium]
MKEFALLFRPTRSVSAAEASARNAGAREWALAGVRDGRLRDAIPLEDEGLVVTREGTEPSPRTPTIAAVLLLRAESMAQAVEMVREHPGLAYGSEIEIREVKSSASRELRS